MPKGVEHFFTRLNTRLTGDGEGWVFVGAPGWRQTPEGYRTPGCIRGQFFRIGPEGAVAAAR